MLARDSKALDMADILIRDVPDDVITGLDKRADRLGLSRAELLRRLCAREAGVSDATITVDDFRRFSERFQDLGNPEVMRGAWE